MTDSFHVYTTTKRTKHYTSDTLCLTRDIRTALHYVKLRYVTLRYSLIRNTHHHLRS